MLNGTENCRYILVAIPKNPPRVYFYELDTAKYSLTNQKTSECLFDLPLRTIEQIIK